jgi:NAD(P)-dependent dehydrogenase (short-subunit alcohol dehydrogenase family)
VNRTVVITGASAGAGRAMAQAFAAHGDRVGIIARGAAGLAAAERDCLDRGAPAVLGVKCDVADAAAVDAAAQRIADTLGPIDVWVNNAMLSVFAPAWQIRPEEYRRVLDVNLLGTVHGTLAALRHMRSRGTGVIVQIGSTLAYRGIPLQAAYCASKHGIQGFCDSLRSELLREYPGIRVTMVQLPALNTPQFSWVRSRLPRHPQPVPPIFQPEVAAEAVLWAAEHAPREMNVTGRTSLIRALNAVGPNLLERIMARSTVDAQQTDEPVDPRTRKDNLDAPLDGDRDAGAHGDFDDQAIRFSPVLWASTHRGAVATAAAGLAGAAALWRWSRRT